MPRQQPSDENILIRRMRTGRVRQFVIAALSVLVATLALLLLSPAMVGAFAFYSITALLLLNAFFALRQTRIILLPIETMLRRMQGIESAVDANKYHVEHLYNKSDDEFACLAAGMDHLIEKLVEKARVANERCLKHIAVVQASPFTFFTVSATGKVFSIIKDHYDLVPFLCLAAGKTPSAKDWGRTNFTTYQHAVQAAFQDQSMHWFDMHFQATDQEPEHNIRSTVAPLNEFSALVVMGDMPAIDKLVEAMSTQSMQAGRTQKHAALKRLAASVAHDGRNIFAVLNNLIEINRHSEDAALREQADIASDAIRRGTDLMTELMQYAGETHYRMQVTRAREAFEKLYSNPTLRALAPANITLISQVSDQPMPDVDIDAAQAWKVPFNLVKNAVEAIGGTPGRIWLSARPFEMTRDAAQGFRHVGPMPMGKGVLTAIADDGPGIDSDIIEKLFDPYTSSKGKGRGLGLATVFSIVEAHNGAIRAISKLGVGTTFEIFLPASRHSSEEIQMISKLAPNGEILLVDDDPAILHTTRLLLETVKTAAHPAANVADALRKMRTLRERIKAVILDGNMESSVSLMQTIREEYPETAIILTSGAPEQSFETYRKENLYDRFLSKPFSVDELVAALGVKA